MRGGDRERLEELMELPSTETMAESQPLEQESSDSWADNSYMGHYWAID